MSNPWSIWSKVPGYRIQTATTDQALHMSGMFMRAARVVHRASLRDRLRAIGRAYLNRACELACVPLAQYYAESSDGDLDLVWVTYRAEAVSTGPRSIPDAMVYLGSVDTLTEDQARSRAIGW